MIKVGINGFGRIGRFVFRSTLEDANKNDVIVVGINDLLPVDYMAYMLKYDTMHGQFNGTIEADVEKSELIVNGNHIRVTAEKDAADLKWDEIGAEYVVESTGSTSQWTALRSISRLVLNMLFFLLLPRKAKTVVRQICSFAV